MLNRDTIVGQFRQPHGALGTLAGTIMACRPSNRRRNAWTVTLLALQPGERVLEIGCGPGVALGQAASAVSPGTVTAVDHSALMVRMARLCTIAQPRVRIEVGDIDVLRNYEHGLDAIFSANVIQFLDDPNEYFTLAIRALAPGGRIASTYQPRSAMAQPEDAHRLAADTESAMRSAGFRDVRTECLPLEPVPAVSVIGYTGP